MQYVIKPNAHACRGVECLPSFTCHTNLGKDDLIPHQYTIMEAMSESLLHCGDHIYVPRCCPEGCTPPRTCN